MIQNIFNFNSIRNNRSYKAFTHNKYDKQQNWYYNNTYDSVSFRGKNKMQQKSADTKNKETQDILNKFLEYDFGYLMHELLANNRAYVGSSTVLIKKADNEERESYIGITKQDSEDMEFFNFNLKEIMELLTQLKNLMIKEYPEEKDNYNSLFQELEKKLLN